MRASSRTQPGYSPDRDSGFSFPELLVAAAIGLIVAVGAMAVLSNAVRSQPRLTERAGQIQQGRTMMDTISRELRQGESVLGATAGGLQVLTYVHSATCGGPAGPTARLCQVTYVCGSSACTRTERNPDGSGTAPAETVAAGISGPQVFCYAPRRTTCPVPTATDPSYVGIRLVFPGDDGGEAVTLDDGVALRNYVPTGV